MTDKQSPSDIPLSFFVSLIEHISRIKPRKANSHGHKGNPHLNSSVVQTFRKWVTELHRRYDPLPPGTTAIVFRLLFPEEDAKRKYDMQEARLAQVLSNTLGLSGRRRGRGEGLVNWKAESAIGCLGLEIRKLFDEGQASLASYQISIAEVDCVLSTLACKSAFSAESVRQDPAISPSPKDLKRAEIVRSLYTRLSAAEACVITQIILKDLRPLLYPLPENETHYTALLTQYKSNALEQLSKFDAMRIWDPSGRMLVAYRVRACLDEAALAYEQVTSGDVGNLSLSPKVGTPVQIPKCSKGQSCGQSLRLLRSSKRVWAETKYDGERTQIHVDIGAGCPRITIYSKSGRDSTMDRVAIHPLLLSAIGFDSPSCKVKKNVILEAEMVAYSEALHRIDEFWRIRSLISTTAVGPRHTRHPRQPVGSDSQDTMAGSQCSLISNASDDGARHLALVFFDILFLDDTSLLSSPYSVRRKTLEDLLHLKPGHVMLTERVTIDMGPNASAGGIEVDAEALLRKVFAAVIADHQEGLVLKADEAPYNDWKMPWVKLKKDYIEGYGDTLDLVLVGATWEKERARELRVAPTAYTTFYIGALSNAAAVKAEPKCMPHFEVFFTASYGLSREELEQLNFRIKSSNLVRCESGKALYGLPYTYNLFKGLPSPAILLSEPILAEVVGGSFTKAAHSKFYELRFPRITKVFRSSERSWTDASTLDQFQRIARESVGHERSHKDVEDWCNELWGKPSSPGAKCPSKRQLTEAEWADKLERADRKSGKRAKKAAGAEPRHRPRSDDSEGENHNGPSLGSPRSPKTLRALGSVTNVWWSLPEIELLGQHTSPGSLAIANSTHLPSPPQTVSHIHRDSSNEQDTHPPTSKYHVGYSERHALHDTADPSRVQKQVAGPGHHQVSHVDDSGRTDDRISRNDGNKSYQSVQDFSSTPQGRFLSDAVIWLASPHSTLRPAWRVPSKLIFPAGQQVHSLESLLQACHWCTEGSMGGCDWAKKGVIFVDDTLETQSAETGERSWTEWPLKALIECRSTLLRGSRSVHCKSVWIFSMKMLSYESSGEAYLDVAAHALCRFG
ncbi:hypothetical protein DAEQUDRAFT_688765 [Daedalea quercina L-15889]|uniref:ATP-dependent DNA ligase family profile domain-containing protein n=1 Tax=Daedalea quercina L-15889 TaxID=1314783 RepID=A0A165RJG7_9APHY|nr:hypothetical protein DAEQUDRAFT_688765 [Daedalea quercina L-15889]